MEAKNNMWNWKPCECITLKCRRESDASCNCDGWWWWGKPKLTWDEDYNWRSYNHWSTIEFWFTVTPADTNLSYTYGGDINNLEVSGFGDWRYIATLYLWNIETGNFGTNFSVANGDTWEVLSTIEFYVARYADSIYVDTSTPLVWAPWTFKRVYLNPSPSRWNVVIEIAMDDNNIASLFNTENGDTAVFALHNIWTTTAHISISGTETVYDLEIEVRDIIRVESISLAESHVEVLANDYISTDFSYSPENADIITDLDILNYNRSAMEASVVDNGEWMWEIQIITHDITPWEYALYIWNDNIWFQDLVVNIQE